MEHAVLLVDDAVRFCHSLQPLLQAERYQVDFAHSGAEALDRLRQRAYAAALVDINLPDGSGLDLCRRLRMQPDFKRLPLIALSADALPEHIARALQTGFNHYLVKPLQIPRLLGILSTLPTQQAAPPTR